MDSVLFPKTVPAELIAWSVTVTVDAVGLSNAIPSNSLPAVPDPRMNASWRGYADKGMTVEPPCEVRRRACPLIVGKYEKKPLKSCGTSNRIYPIGGGSWKKRSRAVASCSPGGMVISTFEPACVPVPSKNCALSVTVSKDSLIRLTSV